ncbi:LysR family transcriptional regulator [Tardiphaga sp. vice352]|uniref:LysR family transcriptional regulator n=1 Tax=unclassified Tardiphaga TaxID=2631404 RepID=UPI0011625282|nr:MULTISPECIES: LysR family transcriptional regulator [unclassified Tardiphaga]QDM18682.1 LysR family transcriptional regulator [Tardiphaga sp. vice278]QDM23678.1 LysR family transcriptional regulator [Tardiphaga sp. vice154]QDM28902.1 LysR family transcriptional regulator [Tardiphaga sp. vice304]QDM34002.1 LysR family transcriptional regulator [Tardiphaga sp. vice352]
MADFKGLETFLWVVTLGSFRGAAQKLNTTQPAISQRIAQLEREMGVRLLQRDRKIASPTPSGRQLMVYAEKLIGMRAEMMAAVSDRSAMRGVLRLGVAETIVHTLLSRLIKSVNEAYPNLTLEIEVDITSNLRTRLLAQEIELALLMGPVSSSTVRNRLLCDYPIGFLASPALGLGDRMLTVQDLARHPIITFPRKTQPYEIVRSLFNRPELPPIRLHASASLATVIHMAIEGLGIAVIPTAIVQNELADGRLQLLNTDVEMQPLTFSASWLASPDTVAIELVAELAAQLTQKTSLQPSPSVDVSAAPRH